MLSCHDLGYQMSIFKEKLYIKFKPLISSLLWKLQILTFDTLNRGRTAFFNGGKPGQVFSVRLLV
jgi:hypothetical protein